MFPLAFGQVVDELHLDVVEHVEFPAGSFLEFVGFLADVH